MAMRIVRCAPRLMDGDKRFCECGHAEWFHVLGTHLGGAVARGSCFWHNAKHTDEKPTQWCECQGFKVSTEKATMRCVQCNGTYKEHKQKRYARAYGALATARHLDTVCDAFVEP